MFKKILFFSIAIIVGIVVALASYFTVTYNHLFSVIDEAIESGEYAKVARVFAVFLDDKPVANQAGTGTAEYKFLMYESTVTFEKVVDEQTTSYLANSYSIILVDIKNMQFSDIKIGDSEVKNDSSFTFSNGELNYTYNFVDNEEGYNLLSSYESNNFLQFNIERSVVEEKLDGIITNIRLSDHNGDAIFELDCNLNFESDFFRTTKELADIYNECMETDDASRFNSFYDDWLVEYENAGYKLGVSKKELMPTIVYVKIIGTVVLYIAIMGVLGYFILRPRRI